MAWGAIAGGALSLGSSLLGRSSDRKRAKQAARQVAPYNIDTGFGNVTFDQKNRTVTGGLTPDQMQLHGGLNQGALGLLQGGGLGGQFSGFAGDVAGQMPGMFNDFLGASQMIPHGAFGGFQNQMAGIGGMYGGGAQAALGQAFGPGQNQMLNSALFGRGMGMMQDDFRDVAANQLDVLRQQAAPQEARQSNAMLQQLYNKGQLAGSGGHEALRSFGEGLGQADFSRQMGANQLGQNLYGMNQQFGQGMMGLGFQGQTRDLARQLGMGQLGQGMLGGMLNTAGAQLGGAVQHSDMINQRAGQRLGESMNMLFGGSQMQNMDMQRLTQMLGGQAGLQQQLHSMMGLGGALGSGQGEAAQAMMGQSGTNPFSGMLGQMGGSMLERHAPTLFPVGSVTG